MSSRKQNKRPRIIRHTPRIVSFEAYFEPPPRPEIPTCSATITTEATIGWRRYNKDHLAAKAERLGVPILNCFQRATYQIDGHWFCRRHAALLALDMLAEDAP